MSGGVGAVPDVLFAAIGNDARFTRKMSGPAAIFKGYAKGVSVISIFIN